MRISRTLLALVAVMLLIVAAGKAGAQEATGETAADVVAKPTSPFQTNLDTALNVAAQADRNILLDFYTDW